MSPGWVLRAAGLAALVIVVSFLAFPVRAASEDAKVERRAAPVWVLPASMPTGLGPAANGGVAVLVSDEQSRIVGDEVWNFRRRVVQLVNEAGVQAMGELKLDFVPSHERLVLHALLVRRGSEVIAKTASQRFEVLKREAELEERGVYDGKRTALALLADLRVGDVLEYEYSIVGRNPVLGPHHGELWFTRSLSELGFVRRRLLTDHAFAVASLGDLDAPPPVPERTGNLYDYRYTATRVKAALLEDRVPSDFVPRALAVVELSDSASWEEVVAWGRKLFELPSPAAPALRELALRLKSEAGPEASVAAVVQAVQTDVRYLSLALNEGTHRPAAPAVVLERHFGDCKDKSLLVVALLRELGIDAEPALVSTFLQRDLAELAPAAGLFDHAVVRVHVGAAEYFVDPTLTQQRGSLEEMAIHDYGYALPLAAGVTAPAAIPVRRDVSPDISTEMTFHAEKPGAAATLDCTTTFRHESAAALRRLRATSATSVFDKGLAADVTRVFPRAVRVGELGFDDVPSRNEVSVFQRFDVPDAWSAPSGKRELVVVPPWQGNYIEPLGAARRAPLAIDYPREVVHVVKIELPVRGKFVADTRRLEEGPFKFELAVVPHGSELELDYKLATRAERVEPAAFNAYRETLSKLERVSQFVITLKPPVSPEAPGGLLAWLAVWAAVLVSALVFVHRFQPYLALGSVPFVPRLRGRRGWLALAGLNVMVLPAFALAILLRTVAIYAPEWLSHDSLLYRTLARPVFARHLGFVTFYVVFLLVVGTYGAYLFWARRRSFPLLFASLMGANSLVSVAYAAIVPAFSSQSGSKPDIGVKDFVGFLWVAYALRSRRMKATFLPEPIEVEAEDPSEATAPSRLDDANAVEAGEADSSPR